MITYIARVESPWSPDRAFAYLSDMRNFEEWDPGTKESRQVEGSGPGPDAVYDLRVGAISLRYRVARFEPDHSFGARAEHPLLRSVDEVTIAPLDGGSLVTYSAELHPQHVVHLVAPVLGRVFDRMGDAAAEGLATALEGRWVR